MAKSYKAIASTLQVLIDKHKDTSKLFLILCGSSMAFMEDQVLGYKSPLYGRRTSQFKIVPFEFFESRKYFNNFSDPDMAAVYGIVGGTPQYLIQLDDRLTLEDNIKDNLLNTSSYLFGEPNNLLFRFWYRFVPSNISIIQKGMADLAYKSINEQLSAYMGAVFEEICMQYLWELNKQGKAAITFTDLGRWWGNDSKNKRETEIDIMGIDGQNSALFYECKWTEDQVDRDVLETLIERSGLFHYAKNYLYIFAKIGFTKSCIDQATKLGNVKLVTFDEIMEGTK